MNKYKWEKTWDKNWGKYLLKVDGLKKEHKSALTLNKSAKNFISALIMQEKIALSDEVVKVARLREDFNKVLDWVKWFDERNNKILNSKDK